MYSDLQLEYPIRQMSVLLSVLHRIWLVWWSVFFNLSKHENRKEVEWQSYRLMMFGTAVCRKPLMAA